MAVRTSIRGASRDPAQIGLIRRAIARMKRVGDERGFDWFASVHGLALPFWCEHGTPLFLPWHRAYLYYFELAMQTRLGPRFTPIEPQDPELADVGLPWWDWSSDDSHREGIPEAYTVEQVDGQSLTFVPVSKAPRRDQRGLAPGLFKYHRVSLRTYR